MCLPDIDNVVFGFHTRHRQCGVCLPYCRLETAIPLLLAAVQQLLLACPTTTRHRQCCVCLPYCRLETAIPHRQCCVCLPYCRLETAIPLLLAAARHRQCGVCLPYCRLETAIPLLLAAVQQLPAACPFPIVD